MSLDLAVDLLITVLGMLATYSEFVGCTPKACRTHSSSPKSRPSVCNSYILRAISRIRRFNSTASPLTQISRKHLNAMIQCSAKFWQVLSSNSKRPYVVRAERTNPAIRRPLSTVRHQILLRALSDQLSLRSVGEYGCDA